MPETAPATVLVVEEDHQLRRLIGKILDGAGYRVLEARTDLHAARLLEGDSDHVDLIVSETPPAPGHFDASARVLLLTCGPAESSSGRSLQKPFRPAALIQAVRDSLG
ncbi:MAG TPA: hypothetical protein VHA11_04110 [Bryobacteraceae bacterium]|nr:hypothetical protein [Bryobacteraceae bacterium]